MKPTCHGWVTLQAKFGIKCAMRAHLAEPIRGPRPASRNNSSCTQHYNPASVAGGHWAHASDQAQALFLRMRSWSEWHINETYVRKEGDNRYALICQPEHIYEYVDASQPPLAHFDAERFCRALPPGHMLFIGDSISTSHFYDTAGLLSATRGSFRASVLPTLVENDTAGLALVRPSDDLWAW